MKEIPLTQGFVVLVDDEDFEALSHYKWHVDKSRGKKTQYAKRTINLKGKYQSIKMHRLIMGLTPEQPHVQVDHINRNGLDNRKENLRIVTLQENLQNKRKYISNTTGLSGVSGEWRLENFRWRAYAYQEKRQIRLYYGKDFFEACCARKSWESRNGRA